MADQPQIQDLVDTLAGQLAESITVRVLAEVKAEVEAGLKSDMVVCHTEVEAAELLKCSARTMAEKRKAGEIYSSRSPNGRPVYTTRQLMDYLGRHELRSKGKVRSGLRGAAGG